MAYLQIQSASEQVAAHLKGEVERGGVERDNARGRVPDEAADIFYSLRAPPATPAVGV